MSDCALCEYRYIRRTATNIHQTNTQLFLIVVEYRIARCQLFQYQVINLQTTASNTLIDVLCRTQGTRNNVNLGFQAHSAHPYWFAYAFLPVNDEILWQYV